MEAVDYKRLREEAGLTQKELAQRAGVSQASLCYWEAGTKSPRLAAVRKLRVALGLNVPEAITPEGGLTGASLKTLREAACLTPRELADLAGVSVYTLRDVERGQKPSWRTTRALERALGLQAPAPREAPDGGVFLELRGGGHTIVDEDDYPRLSCWRWYLDVHGYVVRRQSKKHGVPSIIFLHREILGAPQGLDVHHRDGNPKNNRKSNLTLMRRAAHRREHCRTAGPQRGRAFKGVYHDQGRWLAKICLGGKQHFLGCYDSAEEAAVVYDLAVIYYGGPGAFTNILANPIESEGRGAADDSFQGGECS